ncbi:MAG: DGQHR domain-containing protein [Acidimicrobiaceae bacterium]|nr:DGQHR domain-containing protein [Acidimicrobiaceae bacterium]
MNANGAVIADEGTSPQFGDLRAQAMRFVQGGREVYGFALTLKDLNGLLPRRVDDGIVSDANRRLHQPHADSIREYLWDQPSWLSGPIMVAIDPSLVEFAAFPNTDGHFGEIRIPLEAVGQLKLFDGQHRRRAIYDLIDERRTETRELAERLKRAKSDGLDKSTVAELKQIHEISERRRCQLESEEIPVLLYGEVNIDSLRQMFSDAAKARPIDALTKARFDARDPFNRAAEAVMNSSGLLDGNVEMERSTVSGTSDKLISYNQLATLLRTLQVGYYGRVSKQRALEFDENDELISGPGERFFTFLTKTRDEYRRLTSGDAQPSRERRNTLAFNNTVLRVIAAVWHEWVVRREKDDTVLVELFKDADFSLARGAIWHEAGLVPEGSRTPISRRQEVVAAINHILNQALKLERSIK